MIPAPGSHGGDGARLAAALGVELEAIVDLSMSLNPFAPDVSALLRAHLDAARRYPDAEAATEALAGAIGVAPDRLVLTNGGAEAIALLAAEYPVGDVSDPEFSLYARHLRCRVPGGPRWRSNPNNPTGQLAARAESAAVWDEAFYPLATGCWTRGDEAAVVVGSLTKVFACPGLRVGYAIAPDAEVARALARHRPEWSVNSLACAVVPELLALADLPAWCVDIRAARAALIDVLLSSGIHPEPSDANYLLVRHAPGLRTHLARAGVLVRDTATFGIANGVRIAVPTPADFDRFCSALKGYR